MTGALDPETGLSPARPPAEAAGSTNRGRLFLMLAVGLLAAGFALGALSWVQFGRDSGIPVGLFTQTDFPAVIIAGRLAATGDSARLYDLGAQLAEQQRMAREGYLAISPGDTHLYYPYPYSPFLALLWAALGFLSPLQSMALWDLLSIAAFAVGLWLLLRDLPLAGPARLLIFLAGVTSFPWIVNLEQGQTSGPVALALALGVLYLRRGNDLPAGLWLGLLAIKVQWLPLVLLVLLVKGRWRALIGVLATGLALSAAATLALGPGWAPAYLSVLAGARSNSAAYLLTPAASHSLNGGIYALLGPANSSLVEPLYIAGVLLVAALLVALWARAGWRPGAPAWDALTGATLCAAIFTNPQLNTHDLSLLVLPAALGFASMAGAPAWQGLSPRAALWQGALWLLYFSPLLLVGALLDEQHPLPLRLTTWLIAFALALLAWRSIEARRAG